MPLEQLQQIASDSSSLTDIAHSLLEEEFKRRGIRPGLETTSEKIAPEEVAADNHDESLDANPIMVRRFRDLPEALLAKGSLEAAGIECFLADENMVRMDWFISNLLGGVKLLVRPEEAADARAVLDMPIPENFDVEGVGEYQQPNCPKCNSLEVTFEELNKPLAYGSAFLSLPLPLHNRGWACHACGHTWDGPAEEISAAG